MLMRSCGATSTASPDRVAIIRWRTRWQMTNCLLAGQAFHPSSSLADVDMMESWRRSNPSRAHSWIRSANPRQPATSASLLFATWCGSATVVFGTLYGTINTRGKDHDLTEPTASPKAPATASRPVSILLCWRCSVFLRHDSPPEHMYTLEKHEDLLFSALFVL